MAKPKRIILIRHGESEGNVDRSMYHKVPDYAIQLTNKGRTQSLKAGEELKNLIGQESIRFYISPFFRTRLTFEYLRKAFTETQYIYREDSRLREQDFGHLKSLEEQLAIREARDGYGHFYYRLDGGESGTDVCDRISSFLDTMHRDFEKEYFEDNVIIVTHGLTIRLFLMRWFHLTVEQYEEIKNPFNCQYFVMELQEDNKYKLTTTLDKHKVYHQWKYRPDPDDYEIKLTEEQEDEVEETVVLNRLKNPTGDSIASESFKTNQP